jgi:hypothetical protein
MFMSQVRRVVAIVAAIGACVALPVQAEVRSIDPSAAATSTPASSPVAPQAAAVVTPPSPGIDINADVAPAEGTQGSAATSVTVAPASAVAASGQTYRKDDVIGAAEGVFGKGAKGLADIVQKILKDQGEPNGYIAGREASGAFVVGLRYGSGTLTHSVEGQRPVYWTGPSVGFDVGGDATKVFVLVYNLYDSQDLFKRFPQAEGRAYFVGGFSATYLRRGSIAIIPIRLGVGLRLGANIGYMKFSEKSKWLPF